MTGRPADVLVLGAGLTGSGVALELARRGIAVTLVDQDERAMNRASLRNEGKIHLGFIYAGDPSLATALLQLDGALRFRAIVARWLGDPASWQSLSTPFHYLVASDSIVPPEALARHYAAIESHCRTALAGGEGLDYLGCRPDSLVRELTRDQIAAHFDPDRFIAGFATQERAVDTELLAVAVRRAIDASPRVTFVPRRTVRTVEPTSTGFRVGGDDGGGGRWEMEAVQVVNATWERRAALDAQLGLPAPAGLLHRLKYRTIVRLPERLHGAPSVSMVLGRYGDIVVRADGTAYLSWYPAGLRGWTHDLEPPLEWNTACRGDLTSEVAREVADALRSGIDPWFPGIGESEPLLVDAGAIVAVGHSDVDDRNSGLHDRTRVGVVSHDGWHSVDPGKLTTAPRFALEAADRVAARCEDRPK
jgi:glycine/D-amino acid oxidase-like deaminating enzyme